MTTNIDNYLSTGVNTLSFQGNPSLVETIHNEVAKLDSIDRISAEDPWFTSARLLCDKYALPPNAFENFQRLLCGIRNFPWILLQNPKNDDLDFEEMIESTPSLQWLKDSLEGNGFNIDDIIIMDLFPMLTNTWLDDHPEMRHQAIHDMSKLTLDFIDKFKPPVILSCQCFKPSVNERWFSFQQNETDWLRSSTQGAECHRVSRFCSDKHVTHVVHAFNPATLSYKEWKNDGKWEQLLSGIYALVFKPYARWTVKYKKDLEIQHDHGLRSIEELIKQLRDAMITYEEVRGKRIDIGIST